MKVGTITILTPGVSPDGRLEERGIPGHVQVERLAGRDAGAVDRRLRALGVTSRIVSWGGASVW